eukprot:4846146-Pyramimonas_sp.AAC.1
MGPAPTPAARVTRDWAEGLAPCTDEGTYQFAMSFALLRVAHTDEWDEHLLVCRAPGFEEYLSRTTTEDGDQFVWDVVLPGVP